MMLDPPGVHVGSPLLQLNLILPTNSSGQMGAFPPGEVPGFDLVACCPGSPKVAVAIILSRRMDLSSLTAAWRMTTLPWLYPDRTYFCWGHCCGLVEK